MAEPRRLRLSGPVTIDETIADLRALRGDPEVVSVDLDVALALADEVKHLRAIVEGRTTPPTDEEIEAHASAGGSWLYSCAPGGEPRVIYDAREAQRQARADARNGRASCWWALDAQRRLCASPEVPRG